MADFTKWSNSSLATLQLCAHKFYLRHIRKDRRPGSFAAKRGVAAHKVALEIHKRQMFNAGKWKGEHPLVENMPDGSTKCVEEARDLAAREFERAINDWGGVALTDKEKPLGYAKAKAHAKDTAVALSGLYAGQVAPPIVPVALERKVVITPKDAAMTVEGYIDLVSEAERTPDMPATGEIIRDLKTKEKKPYDEEADRSQQLTMYHLIRLGDVRKMPVAGVLVHLVRTPEAHELQVYTQKTTRTLDDIRMLIRRLNVAVEAVRRGVFIPADPGAPGSPCSWCEYADGTCEYVRRKGTTVDPT